MKRFLACLPGLVGLFVLAGPWQFSAFSQSSPTPSASPSSSATPDVQTTTGPLGEYLTTANGSSLYLFKGDTPDTSTCTGACATVWPPLTVPSGRPPQVGGDAQNSLVGTTTRSDGTIQITYDHQPLYTYSVDTAPGQTNGQGISSFGADWYLVTPAGTQVGASPSPSASPSASPSSSSGSVPTGSGY